MTRSRNQEEKYIIVVYVSCGCTEKEKRGAFFIPFREKVRECRVRRKNIP